MFLYEKYIQHVVRKGVLQIQTHHLPQDMLRYRSPVFVNLCITVFDRDNTASINFDDFIQCSIMVKSLTDQFRGKDVQQRGVLKLHYEEVLGFLFLIFET